MKMGGRFVPVPSEVIDLLTEESYVVFATYIKMLNHYFIERIFNTDGDWVAGRIQASKYELANAITKSRGNFNRSIWPRWEALGLAEIKDGGLYLPMLYKKADEYLQPQKVREEIKELQDEIARMRLVINDISPNSVKVENVKAIPDAPPDGSPRTVSEPIAESQGVSDGSPEAVSGLTEAVSGLTRTVLSINRDQRDKITLPEINKMVTEFYRAIGRDRISKTVRDKAVASFKKLLEDGFTVGEIGYALEWIPKNSKEDVEHFGIVAHMIDQAVRHGRKQETSQEQMSKQQTQHDEMLKQREAEVQEREVFERYKGQLAEEERSNLRNEALLKLRGTPGIQPDMIIDALIGVTENALIRESQIDLAEFRTKEGKV